MSILHPREIETGAFHVLLSIKSRGDDYGLPIRELLNADLKIYREVALIICNGAEHTYPDLITHDQTRLRALNSLRDLWIKQGVKQLLDRFPRYKPNFKCNEG